MDRTIWIVIGIIIIIIFVVEYANVKERDEKVRIELEERQRIQREKEAEQAKKIQELLGDEIRCIIKTVGYGEMVVKYNASTKNIKAYIQRQKGYITIIFDFDFEHDSFAHLRKYLIRLFDENGQYLLHFTTSEFYSSMGDQEYQNYIKITAGRIKVVKLKSVGNVLQYPVYLRDTAYVDAAEFGVTLGR